MLLIIGLAIDDEDEDDESIIEQPANATALAAMRVVRAKRRTVMRVS